MCCDLKNPKYKIGIALGALLLVISAIFAQQAYAGDGIFSNFKKFSKHTFAGPFDISKLNPKRAKEKLVVDFAGLDENLAMNLVVQDSRVPVPSDIIEFDPNATVDQAVSGQENSLVATVSQDGLRTVLKQNFGSLTFTEDEVESISAQMEDQLRTGIMPQQIYLAELLPQLYEQKQIIASAAYEIDTLAKGLRLLMEDLDGLEIQPNSSFSFREYLEGKDSATATDVQMTVMSSLLYKAALQTNWIIDERNISTDLPAGVEPGFEAAIHRNLDLDFAFTNPNQTVFTINTDWNGSNLDLTIEGLPFVHQYDPQVESIKKYDPRTVVRYSAFVSAGAIEMVDKGKKGMEVAVTRNVMLNGSLEEIEDVSVDYYAPHPIIERHSLEKLPEPTPDDTTDSGSGNTDGTTSDGGSTDGSGNTSSGSSDGGSGDGSNSGDGSSSGTNSGSTDGNGSGSNDGSGSGTTGSGSSSGNGSGTNGSGSSNGNGFGNSNGSGGKDDVEYEYDKGGNLIKVDKNGNPID